jgi:hypothetical protein
MNELNLILPSFACVAIICFDSRDSFIYSVFARRSIGAANDFARTFWPKLQKYLAANVCSLDVGVKHDITSDTFHPLNQKVHISSSADNSDNYFLYDPYDD